jgi:hypothetical protein
LATCLRFVIPAKAGIQTAVVLAGRHVERAGLSKRPWIPAFAGMTKEKLCRFPSIPPEVLRYLANQDFQLKTRPILGMQLLVLQSAWSPHSQPALPMTGFAA